MTGEKRGSLGEPIGKGEPFSPLSAQLWAALLLAPVGGSRAPTCGSRRPEW